MLEALFVAFCPWFVAGRGLVERVEGTVAVACAVECVGEHVEGIGVAEFGEVREDNIEPSRGYRRSGCTHERMMWQWCSC